VQVDCSDYIGQSKKTYYADWMYHAEKTTYAEEKHCAVQMYRSDPIGYAWDRGKKVWASGIVLYRFCGTSFNIAEVAFPDYRT
jgi:hypothetical protein